MEKKIKNYDFKVMEPNWPNLEIRKKDYALMMSSYQSLLNQMYLLLNHHHRVNYSKRFWEILLGHWLEVFLNVISDRYKNLERCNLEYRITGATFSYSKDISLTPKDFGAWLKLLGDSTYDNLLLLEIIDNVKVFRFPIEKINIAKISSNEKVKIKKIRFRNTLAKIYKKVMKYTVRDKNYFMLNTYLRAISEFKLQLLLKQFPKKWTETNFELLAEPNLNLRESLGMQIRFNPHEEEFKLATKLVFKFLPICYLEGFDELNRSMTKLPWPKKPAAIFTSNSFYTDELFKLYAALNSERESLYIVGQHGNCYGTNYFFDSPVEERTSDKFISWGWSHKDKQTPGFIFSNIGKGYKHDPKGGLLLVESLFDRPRINPRDYISVNYRNYLDMQFQFISHLQQEIKDVTLVRLHSGHKESGWNDLERWRDFDPKINLDLGKTSFKLLVKNSRLVVFSYESTGLLELLSQNIPTIVFWIGGFDLINEQTKPYYKLLNECGILHFSSESAAAKVNGIWEDVNNWWHSDHVQTNRRKFCDQYARTSKKSIRDLSKLLKA
jgi:putative transferase (TIGR04331 family)